MFKDLLNTKFKDQELIGYKIERPVKQKLEGSKTKKKLFIYQKGRCVFIKLTKEQPKGKGQR